MNLSYISANFQKFPRLQLNHRGETFKALLTSLFAGFVDREALDDVERRLDLSRVAFHGVINVDFVSDEECIVKVAVVDGKPVGLCSTFGDSAGWKSRILDLDSYKNFARELAMASLEGRVARVEAKPLNALADLDNEYVKFLGAKESLFSVENPKSAEAFRHIPKNHRCFFLDSKGHPHLVQKIGKFANTKGMWCADRDTHDVVVVTDGVEGTMDGRELLFELVPGEADFADVTETLSPKARWIADSIDIPGRKVCVLTYHPFRRIPEVTRFTLNSLEDLQRFADAYFDHDIESQYNDGLFSLSSIGFESKILPLD